MTAPSREELSASTHCLKCCQPRAACICSRKTLEAQVKERDFTRQVLGFLRMGGFLAAHVSDSRKESRGRLIGDHDAAGLPDVIAVHAARRILLLLELKTTKGRLRPEQEKWLAALDQVSTQFGSAVALATLVRALTSGGTPVVLARVPRPTKEDWDWLEIVVGGGG